jgi:hypothetical protein
MHKRFFEPHEAEAPAELEQIRRTGKTIYLAPDVEDAMRRRKRDQGVSFSFQVNRAMRGYLGLAETPQP